MAEMQRQVYIFCIGANFNPSTRRLDAPSIGEIIK